MTENELSFIVIGKAIEVHKNLGPGLLEACYENALAYDLREIGLNVKQQEPMPFIYKEIRMPVGYRTDLLIENKLLVELKAVESLAAIHFAITLNYLRLSELKLGLLMNFNSKILKTNIHRIVNNL